MQSAIDELESVIEILNNCKYIIEKNVHDRTKVVTIRRIEKSLSYLRAMRLFLKVAGV